MERDIKDRQWEKSRQDEECVKVAERAREAWGWKKKKRGSGCPEFNQANIEEHSEPFWSINLADGTSAIKRDNAEWVSGREERSRWKVWKFLLSCERFETQQLIRWREKYRAKDRQLSTQRRVFSCTVRIPAHFLFLRYTCACMLCVCVPFMKRSSRLLKERQLRSLAGGHR